MNILHLKYAIVVAELGSISKAAEKLYVAQPNISRAIKELENDLEITIFDRNSKGMVVTPDGERLINYGKKLLNQIDEMEKSFRGHKNKKIFSISVPRASYICSAFVEFSMLLKDIENVELSYKETNAYMVINNILDDDSNLGIVRYSINYDKYFKDLFVKKELKYEVVNEFKHVLIFSKNHPLATKEEINFSDLKGFIEISHADPYVPSIPVSEVSKKEISDDINKHIFVFERASQFELLSKNNETFMWVSPIPEDTLNRYDLVERECVDNFKTYKDLIIYKSSYVLSDLDKVFITKLCESKRKLKKK